MDAAHPAAVTQSHRLWIAVLEREFELVEGSILTKEMAITLLSEHLPASDSGALWSRLQHYAESLAPQGVRMARADGVLTIHGLSVRHAPCPNSRAATPKEASIRTFKALFQRDLQPCNIKRFLKTSTLCEIFKNHAAAVSDPRQFEEILHDALQRAHPQARIVENLRANRSHRDYSISS